MSSGQKLPLRQAERLAGAIVEALRPACERIEVAGSVRRRKPLVGDVELVLVPRLVEGPRTDLFVAPALVSALEPLLDELERQGRLVAHPSSPANGDRYKKRLAVKTGTQIDLFIVRPPADWGPIFAIRTGPAAYSEAAVTELRRRGRRCEDGRVMEGDRHLPCPEEADFFAALGWPMPAPWERL